MRTGWPSSRTSKSSVARSATAVPSSPAAMTSTLTTSTSSWSAKRGSWAEAAVARRRARGRRVRGMRSTAHQGDQLEEGDLRLRPYPDLLFERLDLPVVHEEEEAVAAEGLQRGLALRVPVEPGPLPAPVAVELALGRGGLHQAGKALGEGLVVGL